MFTSLVQRIQKRRVSMLIVIFALGATALITTGCDDTKVDSAQNGQSVNDGTLTAARNPDGTISVNINGAATSYGKVTRIDVWWAEDALPVHTFSFVKQLDEKNSDPQCLGPWNGTTTLAARPQGGTLRFKTFMDSVCDENVIHKRNFEGWSNDVHIGPAAAVEPSPPPVPTAKLFAHATPVGVLGTLIDARLSTSTGTLSYAWSPAACAGTTYPDGAVQGHDGAAVPVGTAWYSGTAPTTCTVVVTDAKGSSSASLDLLGKGLQNDGVLSFAGSTVAVSASNPFLTRACFDLDNSGVYSVPVAMAYDENLGFSTTPVPASLTQIAAGLHRVSATLWERGNNDTCANTTTTGTGFVQTISDVYNVDGAGAVSDARRGLRSSSFVAPSSLRFVSSKTISEGTVDKKSGMIVGATMSGSFSWSTPKSAKGVQRPAAATKLARGAYVMRSISMTTGPLVGKASTLLGTGTVLLRGTNGTLACGTLAGSFVSSTLTLAGGTRSARTLAGNVTGQQVTYVFPTVSAAASRSGGVAGMLATALGWITGDQPTDRAKKPSKKPKPIKVKPVKASGTASLQTAARAAGLPATCQALVQYLPQ